MGMEDIMKALMQSATQSQGQAAPQQGGGADLLSGVLGGLMGAGQQGMQQGGGADLLSGVLGGLMGGGQQRAASQQSGGDMMLGMLEQIIGGQPGQGQQLGVSQMASGNMGGMGMNDPVMSMLQPVIGQVAAKANIPPQIATVVASVALHYLLSSHSSTSVKAPMDLGSVMQELQSGGLSAKTMQNSGMVNDVMQATGLNKQGAVNSLGAVFQMLAGHVQ